MDAKEYFIGLGFKRIEPDNLLREVYRKDDLTVTFVNDKPEWLFKGLGDDEDLIEQFTGNETIDDIKDIIKSEIEKTI